MIMIIKSLQRYYGCRLFEIFIYYTIVKRQCPSRTWHLRPLDAYFPQRVLQSRFWRCLELRFQR